MNYRKLIDEIVAANESFEVWDDPRWSKVFTPAAESEVVAAERRLACRLPDSYREFLLAVNGCPKLGISFGGLLPVQEVNWFADSEPQWARIWSRQTPNLDDITEAEHLECPRDCVRFRQAYLPHLLQIGESFDGSVYLLNPLVKTAAGEWEAWSFANWYPGATRERSFADLVTSTHREVMREVHLRSIEVDEEAVLATALPIIRARIAKGEAPGTAVANYMTTAETSDDSFAAWRRTKQPYYALLKALGYQS